MTVMNKILALLVASFLLVGSCKDDDQTEPDWDPSGLYTLNLSVTGRPPAIITSDSNLEYDHQVIYGEIFDTSQTRCCHWRLSRHDCPPSYSVSNFRVFESNGEYFLYNGIDTSDGNQISFHIPLIIEGNTIKLKPNIPKTERSFHLASVNAMMTSTAKSWPIWFDIINFEMTKLGNGFIIGSWAIIDKRDFCLTTLSNGKQNSYYMSEFADITFTRIGD
tara:strand:- start:3105 stop:3764 length:660 start_codon:yes stop_codon:yes gene_type:complete